MQELLPTETLMPLGKQPADLFLGLCMLTLLYSMQPKAQASKRDTLGLSEKQFAGLESWTAGETTFLAQADENDFFVPPAIREMFGTWDRVAPRNNAGESKDSAEEEDPELECAACRLQNRTVPPK